MKISPSQVRVDMSKDKTAPPAVIAPEPAPKLAPRPKAKPAAEPSFPATGIPSFTEKPKKAAPLPVSPLRDDYGALREAALSVERLKVAAQQELEQIRRMRAEAFRYQQETATRARSEANQLILRARLATQREIEELIRNASEEIQKMLADIRVIRITAQEELSAQRKFTDAAKLNSLSYSFQEEMAKVNSKPRRQPVAPK